MDDNYPQISVIMCVSSDTNNYLNQSIESILNQTFKNFEFIIVNDGNNPSIEKKILSYCSKDNRIIYKFTDGIGLTASLNYAISFSNSNIIARQDYDDISNKSRLEMQFNFLNKNDKYVLCATNFKRIDSKNTIIRNKLRFIFPIFNYKNILAYKNPFIHSSCIFYKKDFLEVNKYNENFIFSQDYELWTRLIKKGSFKILSKNLLYLRIHNQSISSLKNKNQRYYSLIIGLKYLHSEIENEIDMINDINFLTIIEGKYIKNKKIYNDIIARKYVYLYDLVKTYEIVFYDYKIIFKIIQIYINRPSYFIQRLIN